MEDPLRGIYVWVGLFFGLVALEVLFALLMALASWIGWPTFLTGVALISIAGYVYRNTQS